jgi:hypothetical protein
VDELNRPAANVTTVNTEAIQAKIDRARPRAMALRGATGNLPQRRAFPQTGGESLHVKSGDAITKTDVQ